MKRPLLKPKSRSQYQFQGTGQCLTRLSEAKKFGGRIKYSGSVPDERQLLKLPRRTRATDTFRNCIFRGIAGRLSQTMCFQPTPHPNKAAFGLPDFCQLHNPAAVGTFQRIISETGFDALTPFETGQDFKECLCGKERNLYPNCFQSCVGGIQAFAFYATGV